MLACCKAGTDNNAGYTVQDITMTAHTANVRGYQRCKQVPEARRAAHSHTPAHTSNNKERLWLVPKSWMAIATATPPGCRSDSSLFKRRSVADMHFRVYSRASLLCSSAGLPLQRTKIRQEEEYRPTHCAQKLRRCACCTLHMLSVFDHHDLLIIS